jgi:hypothetical protein
MSSSGLWWADDDDDEVISHIIYLPFTIFTVDQNADKGTSIQDILLDCNT